jgi:Ser/Thr protein kinase RdoA (MazF antagonist)
MLLRNWAFDEESLDMFKYYRISSNAIYPFKCRGKTQLLRFAPKEEKRRTDTLAELDFIAYLRNNGYGVLRSVRSLRGEKLIEARTPWGEYFAAVFERVSGVQLSRTDLSDLIIFSYGRALGRLHQLSSQYTPGEPRRWAYSDVLEWIRQELANFPEEALALKEAQMLRSYFAALPRSSANYGLVHYDFEYDNVFYDEQSKSCNVIDFDDAMYHWYAMDIERALNSLQDLVPEVDLFEQKKRLFLDGYRAEFELPDDFEATQHVFRRFAGIYGYVRTLRSMAEHWEHEPEWMTNLRERLSARLVEESRHFGGEL